jgi:hypothetical protein
VQVETVGTMNGLSEGQPKAVMRSCRLPPGTALRAIDVRSASSSRSRSRPSRR